MNKILTIKYNNKIINDDIFDIEKVNIPKLREFNAFKKYCKEEEYKNYNYSGIVSSKFQKKTGLTIEDALKEIDSEFDIILYHPYPLELKIQTDFLQLAELEHPGLTIALNKLWKEIYSEELPKIKLNENILFCVHSNFFVGNQDFWNKFSEDIKKIDELLESNNIDYLFSQTSYNLTDNKEFILELFPFVFERYLTHYLFKNKSTFKIKNISLSEHFKPVPLFTYEEMLVNTLLKINNSRISTFIYFWIRKLIFRIKNL